MDDPNQTPRTIVELANQHLALNGRNGVPVQDTYKIAITKMAKEFQHFLDSQEWLTAKKLLEETRHWIILTTNLPRVGMGKSQTDTTVCALNYNGFVVVRHYSTDRVDHGIEHPLSCEVLAGALITGASPLPDLDNPLGHIRRELDRLAKLVLAK